MQFAPFTTYKDIAIEVVNEISYLILIPMTMTLKSPSEIIDYAVVFLIINLINTIISLSKLRLFIK